MRVKIEVSGNEGGIEITDAKGNPLVRERIRYLHGQSTREYDFPKLHEKPTVRIKGNLKKVREEIT